MSPCIVGSIDIISFENNLGGEWYAGVTATRESGSQRLHLAPAIQSGQQQPPALYLVVFEGYTTRPSFDIIAACWVSCTYVLPYILRIRRDRELVLSTNEFRPDTIRPRVQDPWVLEFVFSKRITVTGQGGGRGAGDEILPPSYGVSTLSLCACAVYA